METNEKESHGCLVACIVVIVIAIIVGVAIYFIFKKVSNNNGYNSDRTRFYERTATLNDITITDESLDFSSFGERMTFTPKCDINNLKITFEFMKGNTSLQKIIKTVGNVKKNNQYSITISLTDLSWDVIKDSFNVQCKYYVSGGTALVFA